MKKISYFLTLIIFAGGLFFVNSGSAEAAGCCVLGGGNCAEPLADGTCSVGIIRVLPCSDASLGCTSVGGSPTTLEFANPLKFTTVSEVLDSLLNNLMGIIAIISVIFIIIGGIMYMTSAGNEAMVTRAKKTWTGAVVGLAIALASPTFLKEIKSILEAEGTGGSAESWVSGALTIQQIAINVLNLLLSIVGILGVIALVIGGGMYLTAYGDEKKIDTGKKFITYAIIGIVVALAALVIVKQINTLITVVPVP